MHYLNPFLPSTLIQHVWDLALSLCGMFFYFSGGSGDVWERTWYMVEGGGTRTTRVALRFEQRLQKACGLVESQLISNYSHPFSLGLIFTPCSIFLPIISPHRRDYNFRVKSQIALLISGWPSSLKREDLSIRSICASFLPQCSIFGSSALISFLLIDFLLSSANT